MRVHNQTGRVSGQDGTAHPTAITSALVVCVLAFSMMQMMIVPAIPAIQHDLHATPGAAGWLVSAFLASTAVATPIAGRMGDMFGKRRVLIIVLAILAAGGVLGVVATSFGLVIAARAIQGVGGAVFPLSFGLIRDALPPRRVPVAIGLISGSYGIGGSAGLVLSGLLVDHLSWRGTFVTGAAMALGALVWMTIAVPAERAHARRRIDVLGALLLLAGLGPVLAGIGQKASGLWSPWRLALLGVGSLFLAAWVRWELRAREPLIDVRLMARAHVWPINAVGLVVGAAMYATGFLVPQLAQSDPSVAGVGFDTTVTGTSLLLLPALASALVAGPVSGLLGRRFGSRVPFIAGLITMTIGFLLTAATLDSLVGVAVGVLLSYGIGLNLALAAMANLIVAAAPSDRTAEGAAVNSTTRMIGGAIGTQVVATLFLSNADGAPPGPADYVVPFVVLGAIILICAMAYVKVTRLHPRAVLR